MANWQELKISINRSAAEGAYAILDQWGIESYAVEDSALVDLAQELGWGDYFPAISPSEQIIITCYFPEEKITASKQKQLRLDLENLREFGFDPGIVVVTEGEISEADWAHAWKAYYHPIRIGQVLIQPSWEELNEQDCAGKIVIELDPGMAFGTGTHPSTAVCVEFLQNLNLQDQVVWDVGTGSGILAILAAKLGAQVEAVDIDPVAVKTAQENQALNGLDFMIRKGTLADLAGTAKVIVANIIADVIAPMLPDVYSKLLPDGYFIAAGVIEGRDQEILTLAKEVGLTLLRREQDGEWVGYLFQKRV